MAKEKETIVTEEENKKEQLLNEALKQIEKQYGKGSIMKLGDRANVDVDLSTWCGWLLFHES